MPPLQNLYKKFRSLTYKLRFRPFRNLSSSREKSHRLKRRKAPPIPQRVRSGLPFIKRVIVIIFYVLQSIKISPYLTAYGGR
nr:MAG TPA: hypothetical protein [Caudoviricetes sp.]